MDELESILHLNGCQQRTAGYNDALDKKDIDTEDMERLEKLTLQEVRAYTTNKIIEELEKLIDNFDWTAGIDPLLDRITELKALNHRKEG